MEAKCIDEEHSQLVLRYENVIGILALGETYDYTAITTSEVIKCYQPIYHSDTDIMDMAVSDDGLYIAIKLKWECKTLVSFMNRFTVENLYT